MPVIPETPNSKSPPRIFREQFLATAERLDAEFRPTPPPLDHWLDPDGGLTMPPDDLLQGPVAGELPAIYERFKGLDPAIDWRRVAAEAFLANVDVDQRLQRSIESALVPLRRTSLPEAFSGLTQYGQPVPSPWLQMVEPPSAGLHWCVYLLPEFMKGNPPQELDLDSIERRPLDLRELNSRHYQTILPSPTMPPLLVIQNPGGTGARRWLLLEGLYRFARAQEKGFERLPCRIVRWEHLRPYLHRRPMRIWKF
jgi:hypothetical protein